MGRQALIEDLRRKAAADAEAVWRSARAEAEQWRLDAAREIEARRVEKTREAAEAARRQEEAALADAERRSREVRATTTAALAERLHGIARDVLRGLGQEGGRHLFQSLADELPPREWQSVHVGPQDLVFARERFPRAQIVCDDSISGGLAVAAEEGRILVRNTLEARLRAAWPDLLPGLVAEVLRESGDRGTAA